MPSLIRKIFDVRTAVRRTLMGRMLFIWSLVIAAVFVDPAPAMAEYGDVVINNYSEAAGVRPVIFPHWFHRIRFRCKVCHTDLGFKFKAGGNDINMYKIIEGKYCGGCHNGHIAWSEKTSPAKPSPPPPPPPAAAPPAAAAAPAVQQYQYPTQPAIAGGANPFNRLLKGATPPHIPPTQTGIH